MRLNFMVRMDHGALLMVWTNVTIMLFALYHFLLDLVPPNYIFQNSGGYSNDVINSSQIISTHQKCLWRCSVNMYLSLHFPELWWLLQWRHQLLSNYIYPSKMPLTMFSEYVPLATFSRTLVTTPMTSSTPLKLYFQISTVFLFKYGKNIRHSCFPPGPPR